MKNRDTASAEPAKREVRLRTRRPRPDGAIDSPKGTLDFLTAAILSPPCASPQTRRIIE